MKHSKVNYYWRLFGTFLAFSTFGIGGLMLSLTVFPLLYILPMKKEKKIRFSRLIAKNIFGFYIWFLKILGLLTYEIKNAEKIRSREGLFLVANHPTLLDVVFLISIANLPNCVVKEGVWNNPFMFCTVRTMGFIKNSNDPEEILRRCGDVLQGGDGLILFPEGTRTEPDGEMIMKRSASHIALICRKNLTPISIKCKPITLTKRHRWYNIPLMGPTHYCIQIEDDIDVKPFIDIDKGRGIGARRLTNHLESKLKIGIR